LCICKENDTTGSYQGLFEYADYDTLDNLENMGNNHKDWGYCVKFGGVKYRNLGTKVKNTIIKFVRQNKLERILQ
jgi:hypothetical protein